MRALVLAEFGTMAVEERALPTLGADQVLLRILFTGICGSDLHGFTGENGRRIPGQVMGHETVATVVELSSDAITDAAVGDLVTINPTISCDHCAACRRGLNHVCAHRRVIGVDPTISSAFGEFMVVPAANVVRMPAGMPVEHGALIEPLSVGFHAARRGGVVEGSTVLIIGAGPIGQAAALAATRLKAARVVVSEPSAARRALVATLGVEVVNPLGNGPHAADLFPEGADITIDAVGSSITLTEALPATAQGGVIVLVGMHSPEIQLPAYTISTDERSVVGAFCYTDAEFRETALWAAEATTQLAPLISRVVSLDEAPAAFRELAQSSEGASKILVSFSDDAR